MPHLHRKLLPLLLLLVCTGCKTADKKKKDPPKPPPPAWIVLRIEVQPDLNPNDLGEPTPLDLRVYQLTDRPTFTEASFEEVWTKDTEVLGTSVVGEPKVLTFEPRPADAPVSAHELKLDPTVKFLGLMGLFSAERKEGLEERKLVVSLDEARMRVLVLSGHKIEIRDPEPEE